MLVFVEMSPFLFKLYSDKINILEIKKKYSKSYNDLVLYSFNS